MTVAPARQQDQSLLGTQTNAHEHWGYTCTLSQTCILLMQMKHLYRLSVLFCFPHTKTPFFLQLGFNAWAVPYICYLCLSLLRNVSKTPNRKHTGYKNTDSHMIILEHVIPCLPFQICILSFLFSFNIKQHCDTGSVDNVCSLALSTGWPLLALKRIQQIPALFKMQMRIPSERSASVR